MSPAAGSTAPFKQDKVFPVAFFDLARSPGLRPKARPGLPLPTLPTLPTIQALTKDGNQAKIKRLRDSPQMVT
jgi:hypothetical protein